MSNVGEKMTKARIGIQKSNSFFAYLSLYLKFKESKDLPEYAGMGVNQFGELSYQKEFVENLSLDELKGVLAHEILHLALLHLGRLKNRDREIWNVACDIVVNCNLRESGFILPQGCLGCDYDKSIRLWDILIEEVNKKSGYEWNGRGEV